MVSKISKSERPKNRLAAFGRSTSKGSADWANCDGLRMQAVVASITAMGGAIIFGMSRDRGAHLITLMLDDSKETIWFDGDADLDEGLYDLVQKLALLEVE